MVALIVDGHSNHLENLKDAQTWNSQYHTCRCGSQKKAKDDDFFNCNFYGFWPPRARLLQPESQINITILI
jgi:hypothetical protein